MNLHETYVEGVSTLSGAVERLKVQRDEMEAIDLNLGVGMGMTILLHNAMLEHAKILLDSGDAVEMLKHYEELKPFFEDNGE